MSMGMHRVGHDWSNLACLHALEEEMQPTPAFLLRIPGTEEPAGLPSMGSHRVASNSSMDILCFSHSSFGKESACNAGDPSSIPRLERSPGEGKVYPLQYSGLETSMDCIIHGVTKSQTPLGNFHFHFHGHLIFDKAGKNRQWRKTVSSTSSSGKTGQLCAKEWNWNIP